jgi:hypothetical protein
MDTIGYYANLTKHVAAISSNIAALDESFRTVAARTDLDVAHIDLLITQAQGMIAAAEALKSVVYEGPAPVVPS